MNACKRSLKHIRRSMGIAMLVTLIRLAVAFLGVSYAEGAADDNHDSPDHNTRSTTQAGCKAIQINRYSYDYGDGSTWDGAVDFDTIFDPANLAQWSYVRDNICTFGLAAQNSYVNRAAALQRKAGTLAQILAQPTVYGCPIVPRVRPQGATCQLGDIDRYTREWHHRALAFLKAHFLNTPGKKLRFEFLGLGKYDPGELPAKCDVNTVLGPERPTATCTTLDAWCAPLPDGTPQICSYVDSVAGNRCVPNDRAYLEMLKQVVTANGISYSDLVFTYEAAFGRSLGDCHRPWEDKDNIVQDIATLTARIRSMFPGAAVGLVEVYAGPEYTPFDTTLNRHLTGPEYFNIMLTTLQDKMGEGNEFEHLAVDWSWDYENYFATRQDAWDDIKAVQDEVYKVQPGIKFSALLSQTGDILEMNNWGYYDSLTTRGIGELIEQRIFWDEYIIESFASLPRIALPENGPCAYVALGSPEPAGNCPFLRAAIDGIQQLIDSGR